MEKDQAATSSSMSAARKPSSELTDVVADWLTVYGKVWREEITEELVLAYNLALSGLLANLVHQACLECLKREKFRPVPAVIREQVAKLRESNELPRLPEEAEEPTDAERTEGRKRLREIMAKIEGVAVPNEIDFEQRRAELEKQKAEVLKKYGSKSS